MKKDNKQDYNLIIPSAKLIPENMRSLGELPSALYPIESKTVLQRLYDQYLDSENIYIVSYENSYKFEEYLNKFKLIKANLIKLKSLKDLGQSILAGINKVKNNSDLSRIIINFGDTLVFEDINNLPLNGFYYSEETSSSDWTFFEENKNGIKSITDKKEINNKDLQLKKCFVGVFSFSDIDYFKECLENTKNNNMDSFYESLLKYNQKYKLKAVKTNSWCDIGHQDKYYNAQLGVKAREFNHIEIDENRAILKKTSNDKDKFIGEILWYLKLPKNLEYASPRIFSYSTDYNNPYIYMEYYSYHTLHELMLYSDIDKKDWNYIFKKIKFIYEDFGKYTVKDKNIIESLKIMYLDKTIHRLNKLKEIEHFKRFFDLSFYINGKEYLSLNEIINILKNEIPNKLFNINEFRIIHGDLCFSNILIDSNNSFVKLIDPRGKFGTFDIYGDSRYELAKLLHSLHGNYDYIIEEQFDKM